MSGHGNKTVTDQDFKATVLESDKLVLVEFGAEWCPPCKALEPILKDVATELSGKVDVYTMDADRNPNTAALELLYKDVYDVKRCAPGMVKDADAARFKHDATTLGGNSGSPVVDLSSGLVVGLHYEGLYRIANYAVPVEKLRVILERVGI